MGTLTIATRPLGRKVDAVGRWQDNVIDLDAVVDDCRRDVDRAVAALRDAVRERNHAAAHLQHLVEGFADGADHR